VRKKKNRINVWVYSSSKPCICKFGFSRKLFSFCVLGSGALVVALAVFGGNHLYQNFLQEAALEAEEVSLESSKEGILGDAILRVRLYEEELRERATAINAILEETKVLDFNLSASPLPEDDEEVAIGGDDGMGGGDQFHLSPVISFRPIKRKSAYSREQKDLRLLNALDFQLRKLKTIPLGIPVQGRITSLFGYRRSPFSGKRHKHSGMDIGVERKTEVVATADGVVLRSGRKGAYGRTIVVHHGNGVDTLYGHLSRINVRVGERVCRGETIGLVGSTGRSTGPHLHYEIRVGGDPIDPKPFVHLASFAKLVD